MKLKKALVALAVSGLMAFTLGAMAGCADNSEQVIRDSLVQELDELKNPEGETLAEISSSLPSSTLTQMGLSSEEIARAMLDGFDGTVDSVTVNGTTAEAVVTLSSKNFVDLQDDLETAMDDIQTEMTENADQYAGMSYSEITDELYAKAGAKIMEVIQNAPVVTHDPITLEYVRNGNTWEPTAGAESELYSALFG